jgi:hypothetical protein
MLRYVFALTHNALTLLRSVIASIIHTLGILVPLSLPIVIALSLSISLIAFIRNHFPVIMYLLFTSLIPLSI